MGVSCAVASKQDPWDEAGEEALWQAVTALRRELQEEGDNDPTVKMSQPHWQLPRGHRLTVMMFGMTGSGKSSMGNLIAGSNVFAAGDDTASVTNLDSVMKWEADDNSLILLDTIGLGDTEIDQEKVVASISDVVESATTGVDILIYVMQNARITDDAIMRLIYITECLWGQECLPNLYIVVTCASRYLHSREEANAWIERQVEISWRFKYIYSIVGQNPERFIFIDNPDPSSGEPRLVERRLASRHALMKIFSLHPRDAIPPLTHAMLKQAHELTESGHIGLDIKELALQSKENRPESNEVQHTSKVKRKRNVKRKSSKEVPITSEFESQRRHFPAIKLWSFNTSFWRQECVRMCLHFGRVPFEDKRVSSEDFRSSGMLVFGTYLEVNGWPVNQMHAMAVVAGKLSGFYPSDPPKAATVDKALRALTDVSFFITKKTVTQDLEGKSKLRAEMMRPGGQLHELLSVLQSLLLQNGRTGLFAGTSVTVADLAAWRAVIWLCSGIVVGVDPEYLASSFPELVQLYRKIEALPDVQDWKSQHTEFYATPEAHWKNWRPYPPASFLSETT